VHNSRRPLGCLIITITVTLTFDLIFIGGPIRDGLSLCQVCRFAGVIFVSAVLVLSCGQTDIITYTHTQREIEREREREIERRMIAILTQLPSGLFPRLAYGSLCVTALIDRLLDL